MACEDGIIAAPAAPWASRNSTICPSERAAPHAAEATTKVATEVRK